MSTSQQNTQKDQRRPPRRPKHGGQHSRSYVSDNDAYTTLTEQNKAIDEGKSRPRGKSHATKKGYGPNDAAAYSDSSAHKIVTLPQRSQATPIKQQAYAGPTFHQSPAASALPLPSFYSKSLPTASPLKATTSNTQSPGKTIAELDQTSTQSAATESTRESTPLDFLFDAARKASITPGAETPNHRHYLSSAADTPISRSPAGREGDSDFPFELDSGDQLAWEGGSSTSTPFKDRIEAVRSQRTPSVGGKSLNEDERKAKTAALKQFLMNAAQNSSGDVDQNNPFNARPVPQQPIKYQHRSNPNTPYNAPGQANSQQYFPPMPAVSYHNPYQSPNRQAPFSNLRNVYQPRQDPPANITNPAVIPERPQTMPAKEQTPIRNNFSDIYNASSRPKEQGAGHHTQPSAQQLEDDLRKFLKLDLVSRG